MNAESGAAKKRKSLTAKIAWLAAAVSVLTALALALFISAFHDSTESHHHVSGARMAAALARRIYENPTPQRIARIAELADVDLRYESPHFAFATDDDMPRFDDVRILRRRGDIALAYGDGRKVALHGVGDRRLMIDLRRHDAWEAASGAIALLAAALAFLWGGFYFLQRRMLAPLASLRADMESAGRGEWRRARAVTNDEIGELAEVFNQMQDRLRATIRSKERLLADASHELRSPLARLRLAAEFVEKEKLRSAMTADIGELDALTGGILEKARLENFSGATEKTRFAIDSVLRALRTKYPRAKFEGGADADICGDEGALLRALGNLLDNAQKFAASETRVILGTDGDFICITVEDDGPGAPEEDLPNLFAPFYRADISRSRDTGGFGLGLSIARAAVIAHGGEISAHNKTPHGLAIRVRLPAVKN
ncbi:MAG: sensor histidine kinase [Gammaproteobacteria bacterium]